MSTPVLDPSGDYVLKLFAAADRVRPGAGSVLAAKARRLTGTPHHAQAPGALNLYAWLLALGRADVFLTYRTSALAARRDNPALRLIDLPPALAVEAHYALTLLDPAAEPFARFILGKHGAAILNRHGFLPLEKR
jgi:ABC-type molybdate transport system substrate-binding protein